MTMFLCLISGCTELPNENDDDVVNESLIEEGWDDEEDADITKPGTPVTKRSPLAQSVMMAQSNLELL